MVAPGVVIGSGVKVQNNVAIYTGATIEDDVFLGPSCVLTNVTNPRSQVSRKSLYENTRIRRGATIGANATITSNLTIGPLRIHRCRRGRDSGCDRLPALIAGMPGRQGGAG